MRSDYPLPSNTSRHRQQLSPILQFARRGITRGHGRWRPLSSRATRRDQTTPPPAASARGHLTFQSRGFFTSLLPAHRKPVRPNAQRESKWKASQAGLHIAVIAQQPANNSDGSLTAIKINPGKSTLPGSLQVVASTCELRGDYSLVG